MELVVPSVSLSSQLGLWSGGEFFDLPAELNQTTP
jgi:hypothetical protein